MQFVPGLFTRTFLAAIVAIAASGDAFAQDEESEADVSESIDDEESAETSEEAEDAALDMSDIDVDLIDEGFLPEEGLEQYVSVSTKITQTVEETPASVYVVTREEIERAGYRSVGEALSFVPGLFTSFDLVNYHVGVRGIFGGSRSGSRTLKVLVDGKPVTVVQSGTYLLGTEFIPMSAVERIEIMRGPASALYGAGALEGAINVVTKRPPYEGETTVGGQVNMSGGALGEAGGSADVSAIVVGEKALFMLAYAGSRTDRSGLVIPEESFFVDNSRFMDGDQQLESRNDIARPQVFFAKAQAAIGGGRLDARAIMQLSDRNAEFYDLTVLSGGSRIRFYNANAALSYEKPFASGFAVKATGGFTKSAPLSGDRFLTTTSSIPVGLESEGRNVVFERDFSSEEFTGAVELQREFGERGLALVGGDVSHDIEQLSQVTEVDPQTGMESQRAAPDKETLTNVAGYGQVLYPVMENLSVAAGVRFDQNSVYGGALTGRLATVYRPLERLSIKAILGRAYKGASPEQLFASPIRDGDFDGVSDLPPQFINGAEVSASYFVSRSLKLSAAGYYNNHADALSNILNSGALVAASFDSETQGAEVSAQFSSTFGDDIAVNATTAVSLQDTHTHENFVDGLRQKPVPDNEIFPRFMWFTKASAQLPAAHLSVFLAHRHIGQRIPSQSNTAAAGAGITGEVQYTLAPYDVVDLGVASMPISIDGTRRVVGSVKVQNVLDSRYSEIGFNGVDVPNLGRVIWARLRLDF